MRASGQPKPYHNFVIIKVTIRLLNPKFYSLNLNSIARPIA